MKTANEQNAAPMFFEKHIEPTARTVWKAPRQTRICLSFIKKGSGIAESFLLQSDFVYFIEAIDSNSSMISLSGAFVARLTMMITMLAQMNAGSSS